MINKKHNILFKLLAAIGTFILGIITSKLIFKKKGDKIENKVQTPITTVTYTPSIRVQNDIKQSNSDAVESAIRAADDLTKSNLNKLKRSRKE